MTRQLPLPSMTQVPPLRTFMSFDILSCHFLLLFTSNEIFNALHSINVRDNISILLPLLQDILNKRLPRFITASYQWTRSNVQETHPLRNPFPCIKFLRRDILVDFHMSFCGTHILSERDDINIDAPQVSLLKYIQGTGAERYLSVSVRLERLFHPSLA